MTVSAGRVSTPRPLRGSLVAVARDIKLSHSVFALPFALLAMVLAAAWAGRLPHVVEIGLIVLCMVLARTVAMTMNRWSDATYDADNPRTSRRAIPSGTVHPQFVLGVAIACALAFVVTTAGFWILRGNLWPLLLSPLVLLYLVGYSYTKRFTWLCHVYLGAALALSPLAAAIAIEPRYLGETTPWLLFALVVGWVAGFDIIYALQDVDVDLAQGLRSMPARFGADRALWISRGFHAGVIACLVGLWRTSPLLGPFFLAAATITAALLVLEHGLVWGSRTNRLNLAFFTVNGVISLLLGGAGVVDALMRA